MTTDCPNCSWMLDGDMAPGSGVSCPFCGETFEFCANPFEQLRKFMQTWPAVEHGPFLDHGCPRKNYTGWIVHRLRQNDPASVISLMAEVSQDPESAAEKVNALWTFDFSPYLLADPETVEELRALWLRVRFAGHARPESQNIATLLQQTVWTRKIELTPDWIGNVLDLFTQQRAALDPDEAEETGPVTESDLALQLPQGNPLFDWAAQAPPAIRERLTSALRMCSYGNEGYSYQFKLDRAFEDRWGADFGYASRCILESNIFCDPLPETYEKLFSKEEFAALLSECSLEAKTSYTRKRMLDLLLSMPDGTAWLEKKIRDQRYVRLHPSLSTHLDEIRRWLLRSVRLYEAVAMIPVPGNRF